MRSHFGAMRRDEIAGDLQRAVLVKGAVVAKASEIKLQRLRLDQPFGGDIVDDDMREIWLARHRAERGELRRGEAHQIGRVLVRVGHEVEFSLVRRSRQRGLPAEQRGALMRLGHARNNAAASAASSGNRLTDPASPGILPRAE